MKNKKFDEEKNEWIRILEHPDKWTEVGAAVCEVQFEFNPARMQIRSTADAPLIEPRDHLCHTHPAEVMLEGEKLIHRWGHGSHQYWGRFRDDLQEDIMAILNNPPCEPMSMIEDIPSRNG